MLRGFFFSSGENNLGVKGRRAGGFRLWQLATHTVQVSMVAEDRSNDKDSPQIMGTERKM